MTATLRTGPAPVPSSTTHFVSVGRHRRRSRRSPPPSTRRRRCRAARWRSVPRWRPRRPRPSISSPPSSRIDVDEVAVTRCAEMDRAVGEASGELIGDRLHPGCRNDRVAVGEHPEDDVEHPAAVAQFGIELDAADERSEEPVDDRRRETVGVERRGGGDVVACEQTGRVHAPQTRPGAARCAPCRTGCRSGRSPWRARLVGRRNGSDTTDPLPLRHTSAPGLERLEVECVHVELAVHLGVGGERDLEPAVEGEPVDDVAADAAADAVAMPRRSATRWPASCRCTAHDSPARPAPTMTTGASPFGVSLTCSSRSRSAPSRSGWANSKPSASSTVGTHLLAAEQQVVGEFAAEHQLGAELRDREERRSAEHVAERVGELGVGDRVRCGEIDRALERRS